MYLQVFKIFSSSKLIVHQCFSVRILLDLNLKWLRSAGTRPETGSSPRSRPNGDGAGEPTSSKGWVRFQKLCKVGKRISTTKLEPIWKFKQRFCHFSYFFGVVDKSVRVYDDLGKVFNESTILYMLCTKNDAGYPFMRASA